MKKPLSNRCAPRTRESTVPPARVLLFPCLVQLPRGEAPRASGVTAAGEWDRLQLVFENGPPGDTARVRLGR